MEISKLKSIELKKSISTKQNNGVYVNTFQKVDDYKVWKQDVEDEISVSIYGANIYKVSKLKSPRKKLETFLIEKNNNTDDNLSKYFVFYDDTMYKINDAKLSGITIERL